MQHEFELFDCSLLILGVLQKSGDKILKNFPGSYTSKLLEFKIFLQVKQLHVFNEL